MGWWSKDIMGGDIPLDFEDLLYGLAKVEKFPEDVDGNTIGMADIPVKSLTHEVINAYIAYIEKDKYEKEIGYQVLGVMMMKIGAPISKELKAKIIEAAQLDEWAMADTDRAFIMGQFIGILSAYEGTPIEIKSKGLFETMAEKLNEGIVLFDDSDLTKQMKKLSNKKIK
jgi:hypothetical protein